MKTQITQSLIILLKLILFIVAMVYYKLESGMISDTFFAICFALFLLELTKGGKRMKIIEPKEQLQQEIQDSIDTIQESSKRLQAFLQGIFYMQKSINNVEGYTAEENYISTASNISCYASTIREKLKALDDALATDSVVEEKLI